MPQAKRRKKAAQPAQPSISRHLSRGLRESALLALLAVAVYLLISLFTYHPQDPAWSYSGNGGGIANAGGVAGAWFSDITLYFFGYLALLFPALVGYSGWSIYRAKRDKADSGRHPAAVRWVGFFLTLSAGTGIAHLHFSHLNFVEPVLAFPQDAGGILGSVVAAFLVGAFSFIGATLFLLVLFLTGLTLLTGMSWLALMDFTGQVTYKLMTWVSTQSDRVRDALVARRARPSQIVKVDKKKTERRTPARSEPILKPVKIRERAEQERQVPLFDTPPDGDLPPLVLLDPPKPIEGGYSADALQAMSRQVEIKLKDFGIEVEVVAVHPGPVITRFELQPAPGVKASRITNLSKDLARALSTVSVRIVEVIPGKSVIGLEIPNQVREIIALSEIIKSKEYDKAASPLTLALGKDIGGKPIVVDLARMPHLLVAGTTGSGKSVALNAMVLSLLFKATAHDVRLIMVDPKMLELSVYEGIPHLLTPVVTDMKEAANALRWAVGEMDRRYQLMAVLGVRNIAGFNHKVKEAMDRGVPLTDPFYKPPEIVGEGEAPAPPPLATLPYIVIIIDELADMMLLVGKKVEELIARLAQKARASGVHLILATQRPSVDVITGLIKSNIPTRIAFQVSSKIDSRTIIDQGGAETLLGHGDMLYLAPGRGIPNRIHGAFVDDHEVHRIVKHLKNMGQPDYNEDILQEMPEGNGGGFAGTEGSSKDGDPLYDQAVRIVTETRRASISAVQRRLKIGYNRAARMIEAMENAGIVGPLESNGARGVLAPPPPES